MGCAHAEFDLVAPPELSTHVDTKTDAVVKKDRLEYRLNTVDGRLVMRIYNDTDSAIQLLGDQSTVVDPQGQSHPLKSQSIAPQSFVKLLLPPMRPQLERSGPNVGFGFGVIGRAGRFDHAGYVGEGRYPGEPEYFDVVSDDATYWEWGGETQIRLTLTLRSIDKTLTHTFVFRRVMV